MTFAEIYLQPHLVFGELNFEEYCSKIPKFYFRMGVPKDVIQNFEVVEKMLALSYYEYKLIDEAYAKAIHTFEMAMSIRYKEIFPQSKKATFNILITELSKLNLFDTDLDTLKHVKYMRNHYSHPERHSFGGIVFWKRIEFTSHLINEMYEDIELRLERNKITEEFLHQLEKANLNKSLVMEIEGKQTILFSMSLLFINNKRTPKTCLLVCTPLFDMEQDGDSIIVPFVFKSKLSNPTFIDGSLKGESFSAKKQVSFSPISKHPNLFPTFEKWNSEYERKKNKFQYETSTGFYITEIYQHEVQEFQEM
ncbi:MAG: hypothetical protein IPK08_03085 [Bacteroidetes bacterium]|nr:hypothetical protein [Bacteroidota bacterium]